MIITSTLSQVAKNHKRHLVKILKLEKIANFWSTVHLMHPGQLDIFCILSYIGHQSANTEQRNYDTFFFVHQSIVAEILNQAFYLQSIFLWNSFFLQRHSTSFAWWWSQSCCMSKSKLTQTRIEEASRFPNKLCWASPQKTKRKSIFSSKCTKLE